MKRNSAALVAVLLILLTLIHITPSAARELIGNLAEAPLTRIGTGSAEGEFIAVALGEGLLAQLRLEDQEGSVLVLELIRPDTGEVIRHKVLAENEFSYGWALTLRIDGGVSMLDRNRMTLVMYDSELTETLRFQVPGATGYEQAMADTAGQFLYYAKGSRIIRYQLPKGTAKEIPVGLPAPWTFGEFLGVQDDLLLFTLMGMDGLTVLGQIDSLGRVSHTPVPAGFDAMYGGLAFQSHGEEALLTPLPASGVFTHISGWRNGEHMLAYEDGLLLTATFSSRASLKLMDLRSGTLVGELEPEGLGDTLYAETALLSREGYVLIVLSNYEQGQFALYRWDYGKTPLISKTGIRQVSLGDIRGEHDELAKRVRERHGIGVFIREEGAAFVNETYQGTPLRYELHLGAALREVDAFLEKLPPGMLNDLLVAPYERFSIYLCGPIKPKNASGISVASGFASGFQDNRYIALNALDTGLFSNLAHEMMHVMEDRLWQDVLPGEDPPISRWSLLSPADAPDRGFAYTYHNQDGSDWYDDRYTLGWLDSENAQADGIWFIDAYSRTYPLEDRARVFEHLFTSADGEEQLFIQPNLLLKAQSLSALIRHAFPSVQRVPKAHWESYLTLMPYETLLRLLSPEEGEEWPKAG